MTASGLRYCNFKGTALAAAGLLVLCASGPATTSTDGAGGTAQIRYDAAGNVAELEDATGQIQFRSYDTLDRLTGVDDPVTGVSATAYDPNGNVDAVTDSAGAVTSFEYDLVNRITKTIDGLLGSLRKITDAGGLVVSSYDYDSYGNIEASFEGIANPFTYTGRELDAESGLYYYRARYYDAAGKFLGEDPLGFTAGDFNLSRYVFNNPVNLTDPGGEIVPQLIGGCVVCGAFEAGLQLIGNGSRLGCLDFGGIAGGCALDAATAVGAGPAVALFGRGLGGAQRTGPILRRLLKDQSGAVRISGRAVTQAAKLSGKKLQKLRKLWQKAATSQGRKGS